MSENIEVNRAQAELMGGRICVAAGLAAQSECRMLELLGEFDEVNAIRWWHGVKSLAHWLSWCCALKPGTAREHVRVARAMRRIPTVTAAFREGRLSYSKVREVTRVVDLVGEQRLCELALTATASQLTRMIAACRSTTGSRIAQQRQRRLSWTERDDEMIDFQVRLPKEEAALLIAAITAAKDQFGGPPPSACPGPGSQVDTTPGYGYVDAIIDVARVFLDTAPQDRSGEDRTLVVIHVAAEQLTQPDGGNAPAGTPAEPLAEPEGTLPQERRPRRTRTLPPERRTSPRPSRRGTSPQARPTRPARRWARR